MTDRLAETIRELGDRRRAGATPLADAAFRARVDERLDHLDAQLGEVQRRINGLLFVLLGAVATNLITAVAA